MFCLLRSELEDNKLEETRYEAKIFEKKIKQLRKDLKKFE
jgi:hypothetical protein